MIFENGLAKGQYPLRLSQGYTLLFLLSLSSLTLFPRWADGECCLSGISFLGWFNPVDSFYIPCPSGFLQEQKARKWKWEIMGRYFMAFRKWGWTFQKNLLTLRRYKCGGQKAWMNCLWSLSLAKSSTGHSLNLGGKSHRAVECGKHGCRSQAPLCKS